MIRNMLIRLDALARRLTPFGITLALVILSMVPMRIPEFAAIAPTFALMAVYHWSLYRPELMPAPAVFLIGLSQDFLLGDHMGVYAFIFLFVYMGVLAQRRFLVGKSFSVVWIGFLAVAGAATGIHWLLESALHSTLLGAKGFFYQYVMTMGAFPVLSWFLTRWQQTYLRFD